MTQLARLLVPLAVLLPLALEPAGRAEAPREEPALQILRDVSQHEGDRAYATEALTKVDALIARGPARGVDHYVRGQILSRLERVEDALAAYEQATRLDPKLGDAHYNAGVLLAELGREREAMDSWERAATLDAQDADAAFNLGQAHYNRGEYDRALTWWKRARDLEPDSFEVLKKVLQAENALHQPEAKKTRELLLALWKTSPDMRVRGLKEFVFHQLEVGKAHVYAYENLKPGGDRYYLYAFRVVSSKTQQLVGSVSLETSAALREQGSAWVLGVDLASGHKTIGPTFEALPTLAELEPLVRQTVEAEFPDAVAGK